MGFIVFKAAFSALGGFNVDKTSLLFGGPCLMAVFRVSQTAAAGDHCSPRRRAQHGVRLLPEEL